jgi:hypothetical protein
METLGKLFGGDAKVKIMRLVLFSPESAFDLETIVEKVRERPRVVRRTLSELIAIGLVRRRYFFRTVLKKRARRVAAIKRRALGFALDPNFSHLAALQNLLLNTTLMRDERIARKLQVVGRLKLVIIAGVFIQDSESRVDLLVVGDGLRKAALLSVVKKLEAEIGKELRYAVFETSEFQYRLGLYDKLIRDILDFPHKKIMDKLGIVSIARQL